MINRILKIMICFTLFSCSSKKGTDVRIYLPENYNKKYIIIFFNHKNGLPKETVNGKKIYRIPESGVLYTQASQQMKRMFHEDFFFVNNKNELRKIPSYSSTKYHKTKINPKKIYVFTGFFADKETFGYSCRYSFIGTPSQIKGKNGIIKPLSKTNHIVDSLAQYKR